MVRCCSRHCVHQLGGHPTRIPRTIFLIKNNFLWCTVCQACILIKFFKGPNYACPCCGTNVRIRILRKLGLLKSYNNCVVNTFRPTLEEIQMLASPEIDTMQQDTAVVQIPEINSALRKRTPTNMMIKLFSAS